MSATFDEDPTEIPGCEPVRWDDVTLKSPIRSTLDDDPPTVLARIPPRTRASEKSWCAPRRVELHPRRLAGSMPRLWPPDFVSADPRGLPRKQPSATTVEVDLRAAGIVGRGRTLAIGAVIALVFVLLVWLGR
jgi:hypothetical protein